MGDYHSAAVLLVSLLSAILVNHVECFSSGAPLEACGTLSPLPAGHGAQPQTTPVPYELDLSSLLDENGDFSYVPGETYTLSFNGSGTFRGILLQGRLIADDTTPAGTFVNTDSQTEISACSPPEISITHTNAQDKTMITTNWIAPSEGTGPLQIGFAVVQEQVIFWANERSPPIMERQNIIVTTEEPATTDNVVITESPVVTDDTGGFGGDPHFSIMLPTKKQLCYSVQGEDGFIFNLISNNVMQMNALFVADSEREEVTWIGGLGLVIKNASYKASTTTTIKFDAKDKKVQVGNDLFLKAEKIDKLTFMNGKLSISEAERDFNCSCFPVTVNLQDIGLNFTVHFVKNNHIDMKWERVENQPRKSHGIIGQFLRKGVDIDETRRILQLPGMEPVPVMRKPIWHFMERDTPEEKLCWVAMNPGYQGKRLIEGSYLDYVVDDILSDDFKY